MLSLLSKILKNIPDLSNKEKEYNRLVTQPIITPKQPKTIGIEKPYGSQEFIIWEIDCVKPVYMRIEANSNQYVVYIDSVKFYRNWLKSSINRYDSAFYCPLLKDMPKDYKYYWAVRGFSIGQSNPVPLARPISNTNGLLSFDDGITRTLFLLHNNASSFPVASYSIEDAILLNQHFGLTNAPLTTKEIIKDYLTHTNI